MDFLEELFDFGNRNRNRNRKRRGKGTSDHDHDEGEGFNFFSPSPKAGECPKCHYPRSPRFTLLRRLWHEIQALSGLSDNEVADRQARFGHNELPEPMFLLLVACGLVYMFVGEPKDALLLLGFVIIMMGITIFQEGKTEKTLDALRNLSSPRATVIRNGARTTIPGREVVPSESVPVRKSPLDIMADAEIDMARPGGAHADDESDPAYRPSGLSRLPPLQCLS